MKDFDSWNMRKKQIQDTKRLLFREREIWFIAVGSNIGDEQDGKGERFWRPVIILKSFNSHIFFGVPLTSKVRSGRYYFSFQLRQQTRTALLSQLRLFDAKRIIRIIGTLSWSDFHELKRRLVKLIR